MFDEHFDVVIVGCGPGGAVCGAYLARQGMKVLAIERDAFPRFHIGESLTGSAGNVIRDLGLGPAMAEHEFPDKPGVTVIGRDAENEFFVPVLAQTWQVRRAPFDNLLLEAAVKAGMEHRLGRATAVHREGEKVVGLTYVPDGETEPKNIGCRVLVDASGAAVFLSWRGVAGPRRIDAFARQLAFHSQYTGVERDPGRFGDNTSIFYGKVRHWAWVIPVSPTVDSLGIVIPTDVYKAECGSPGKAISWGLDHVNPDLKRRFANAERVERVRANKDYSYRVDPFVGDGWLCIGDAHRFLDPIFSFGVSFAMAEAIKAAEAIGQAFETGDCIEPFRAYQTWSNTGQDIASDLIRYFWKYPVFFGYQMRNNEMRDEVIRLFAGECFKPEGMRVPQIFREALAEADAQIAS